MRWFLILAVIGAALAVPQRTTRIVGGRPTTIEQFPYMSNLQFCFWGAWFSQACGGSLITKSAVLTAAHCVNNALSVNVWRVRLGSTYSEYGGIDHTIARFIVHPQYDPRLLISDVAIIRLVTPATLSNSVQVARIAGPNYALPDFQRVYAVGWGNIEQGGPTSDVLRYVDMYTINQSLCVARYAYLKTLPGFQNWPDVTPDMFCAGVLNVGGRDACQGDSGGPVIQQHDIVVGIISWGYGCADPFYPGVNVRVSSYTHWIATNAVN